MCKMQKFSKDDVRKQFNKKLYYVGYIFDSVDFSFISTIPQAIL